MRILCASVCEARGRARALAETHIAILVGEKALSLLVDSGQGQEKRTLLPGNKAV